MILLLQHPADINVQCITDVPQPDITVVIDAADNCSTPVITFLSDMSDGQTCLETITRTYRVTDDCGNFIDVVQMIIVEDTIAPIVLNDLSDINVNCDNIPDPPTLQFDDCSTVQIIGDNPQVTNTFDGTDNDYEITWTWDFEDACGNPGQATQTVYVTTINTINLESDDRCYDDGTIDLFDYYNGTDMSGTWIVVSGDTTLDDEYFDPSDVELGDYVFSYTVADNGCIDTTEVTITINDDCIVERLW